MGESPLIESQDIMECKDNMETEDESVNDDTNGGVGQLTRLINSTW